MKENYISYVIEEYISDGNFDAVFGEEWIDEAQLEALIPVVCDYAFAEYGIDAQGKYADQTASIFEGLKANNGIVRHGDDYSDYWYKLRPPYKKKYLEELLVKNPVTSRIRGLGEEALRRALNKIVAEDRLRSMEEKWADETSGESADAAASERAEGEEQREFPRSPNPKFFESEARKEEFVSLAEEALEQVEKSELSNSDKAQAQGYLIAAKALSETPDPPVDLIWTILNRANSIAGIASFFVALITFVAMVGS